MLLAMSIAKSLNKDKDQRKNLAHELRSLPKVIEETLKLSNEILNIVPNIADKHNALFLGRGMFFPIVQEGALKLKEISYIHAEAYPAGELKHGPLALVDDQIPVVALSPENTLTEKLVSNLEEVNTFKCLSAASYWHQLFILFHFRSLHIRSLVKEAPI